MKEPTFKDFAAYVWRTNQMLAEEGVEEWDNLFEFYRAGFSDACSQFEAMPGAICIAALRTRKMNWKK